MYAIISNNDVLQYCDGFDYCYKLKSGSPQIVKDKAKATGIFATPNVYNLEGFEDFDAPQVTVRPVNGNDLIFELEADLEEAYELLYGGDEA